MKRRRVRALLYRLAADAEPVSREELCYLFWADASPEMARRRLTRLLNTLRSALPESDFILIDEEKAALRPDRVRVDSRQFAAASTSGDLTGLQAAVDLYGGPFLQGFFLPDAPEYEAWQLAAGDRLKRLYLNALTQLVERLAEAGEQARAADYARRYLAVDDLDETMHRRLIALYAALGQRAAARQQYELCAIVLERELGVSPLPETRAALDPEHHIQPSGPALNPIYPVSETSLIGREEELAILYAARERLRGGGFLLIRGEPGLGKSHLLREFSYRWPGLVLRGSAYPGHQQLPFQLLVDLLRTQLPPERWADVPPVWRRELLPLLPELEAWFPDRPPPVVMQPEQARARLLEALQQVLAALPRPVMLCLEDLHWVDEATLSWLRLMAGRWAASGVLIVATSWPNQSSAFETMCRDWQRAGRFATLELDELAPAAAQALLQTKMLPSTLAARIQAVAGGNPFFLLALATQLSSSEADQDKDLPLPPTVREAILVRLNDLSPLARQLLEVTAVLGSQANEVLLRETAARSAGEVVDGLDELFAARLLRFDPADVADTSLKLPHFLLQQVVYDELTPWRRRLLHQRAAEALKSRAEAVPAVRAQHLSLAGSWEEAFACWGEAADLALHSHAYEVALQHVNCAFDLLPRFKAGVDVRLYLLRRRLFLARMLVKLPDWEANAAELLALAEGAGSVDGQLEALEARLSLYVLQSRFLELEETAVRALDLAVGHRRLAAAARIQQTYGWHLADALGRSREGLAHLEEACRLAEAAADGQILYAALCNLAFVQRAEGRCAAARASALRALALTAYRPDGPLRPEFADGLRELAEANAYLGRWEEAWRQLQELKTLYHSLDDPWNHGAVLFNFGYYSANIGQYEAAITAMRQLVALSERVGLAADSAYGIWHRAGLARVLLAAGEIDEAGAVLDSLDTASLPPGRPYLAWARAAAEYEASCGRLDIAQSILRPAVVWWRRSASLHDADVLVQLALLLHASGNLEQARIAIEEATVFLEPTDIQRYRLRLYAARWVILGHPADLAAARAVLNEQMAQFTDPDLRRAFVENVLFHRDISG